MVKSLVIRLALSASACSLVLSFGVPARVHSATCLPPQDLSELAARSDAVVVARAMRSASESRGSLIFTRTEFVIEERLSGPAGTGDAIEVETPGGEVEGRAWRVSGTPHFALGASYFLCLERKGESLWRPAMLSWGVLEGVTAADGTRMLAPVSDVGRARLAARPDGLVPEALATYRRATFLAHLRDVLGGRAGWDQASAVAEAELVTRQRKAPPPGCAFFTDGGRRLRWNAFDTGGTATIAGRAPGEESLPGGGFEEVVEALDMWMDIPGAGFNLLYDGERDVSVSCGRGEDVAPNAILFGDPCSDIGDLSRCSGVLAFGGPLTDGLHRFDGETWETIVGWIVVVNDGAGCLGSAGYRSMIAHELGHGLGFGHVADERALMFESCCNSINATDTLCSVFAYPAQDPENQRPILDAGADRRLVIAARTAFLSASVVDDGLPIGSEVSVRWEQLSGPGAVVFGDAASAETSVSFPLSGRYALRVTADDGERVGADYLQLDVETEAGNQITVEFQQRTADYAGTVDTDLGEGDPAAENSRGPELEVDGRSAASSDGEVHVLLRFDGIFGTGAGQVPPGATIRSAVLSLSTTNLGDGATFHRMLQPWSDESTWLDFDGPGVARGTDALDAIDGTATGADGIVDVDITRSVSAWSDDPCSNHGWALLPRGTNGWRFSSAEGDAPPRLSITYSPGAEEALIAVGDTWTYFKGLEDPPPDWNRADFRVAPADDRWFEGPTGIGYGDGDDATVLDDMEGRYLTFYARREFPLEAPGSLRRLLLRIDYDDGFVAYLNGEEVARSRSMQSVGAPVSRTAQSDSREAGEVELYELDTSPLRAGLNVLAIEVHNTAISSSDVSFVPRLHAVSSPIEGGDVWSFRRGSLPIPDDWFREAFDDSDWERGPTGIGYGDGDDRTVLADMRGNYVSVYVRKVFDIAPTETASAFNLTVVYDDGVIVYLNGEELGRADMPAGEIATGTRAITSGDARTVVFRIERDRLRSGPNLLAASVHNATLGSSDLSFDAVLVPLRTEAREVDCDAPPAPPAILRGDVTDDAGVNIADAVTLLSFLFDSGQAPPCPDAADVDDDGSLTIADAVNLLAALFSGGELAAPGAVCGVDPTEDGLGECGSSVCER